LLYYDLQATQPGSEGFRDVRPKDRIAIVRIDRGVQNRTSTRNWWPVLEEIRDELFEFFDTIRLFIHMQQPGVPGGLPRIVERRAASSSLLEKWR
jgi:hypothetical protein